MTTLQSRARALREAADTVVRTYSHRTNETEDLVIAARELLEAIEKSKVSEVNDFPGAKAGSRGTVYFSPNERAEGDE